MANMPTAAPSQPPQYPGLRLPERLVLAAWQRIHAGQFQRFEYNVHIGQGHDPGPNYSPAIRQMAVQNLQKKIDVVAYGWDRTTLIEVKERATPGAIGQLITYSHVWEAERPGMQPPLLKIIAARVSPGVIEAAQRVGIVVEIVAVDFSGVTGRV